MTTPGVTPGVTPVPVGADIAVHPARLGSAGNAGSIERITGAVTVAVAGSGAGASSRSAARSRSVAAGRSGSQRSAVGRSRWSSPYWSTETLLLPDEDREAAGLERVLRTEENQRSTSSRIS